MLNLNTIIVTVLMALIAPYANACTGNYQCSVGDVCVKPDPYTLNGVCVTPMTQYGTQDLLAPSRPQLPNGGVMGTTCYNSFQCGYGSQCIKTGYSMTGVCVSN